MRIEELHLQNFRGFRELKLTLPSDLAVFIGVNGSGKSSILDSIAIFLSQYVYQLRSGDKFDLKDDDININSNTVSISTLVKVDSQNKLDWKICKKRDKTQLEGSNLWFHRPLKSIVKILSQEELHTGSDYNY